MNLVWNKKKIKEMLNTKLEKSYSDNSPLLKQDINTLKMILNMPIKDEIVIHREKVYSPEILYSLKRVKNIGIPIHKDIRNFKIYTKDDGIKFIKSKMSFLERNKLNDMIDLSLINFNYKDAKDYYLPYEKQNLIGISYDGTIDSMRKFMHEFGHALDWTNINTFDELSNYLVSNYTETMAIFKELEFLDRLDLSKSNVKEQKSMFLKNYQYKILYYKNTSKYNCSYMLAHYLFYLSKNDPVKYREYMEMYKEFIKRYDDNKLITKMKIKSDDLVLAYKKYLKEYSSM